MARRVRDIKRKGLRRIPDPAYPSPYVPQDYEYDERETYQPGREGGGLIAPLLIVILAVAVAVLYFRGPSESSEPGAKPVTGTQPAGIIPARVTASTLYLREGPGPQYQATYLLPRNWRVSMLEESLTDSGEVWVKVRLETRQGLQTGWVNRKYLAQ
jgi:hypothetical protein